MPIGPRTAEEEQKRQRGKAALQAFPSPEGISPGIIGSMITGVVKWRESGTKLGFDPWFRKQVDIKFSPKPPPLAVPTVGEEVGTQAKRERPRGRRETFLTGDLIPETTKKRVLG